MVNNCGIYYIQNTKTSQLYIGQTKDIKRREREHFRKLKSNSHVNTHLQNSFNKYGEDCFKFKVIEYCEPSELDDLEIKYMALFNVQSTGFNICDGGVHICPDNSNENHGMWRDDIPNDLLKNLYLQEEYNSEDLSKLFNCSRRTINRRLKKIFPKEELEKLKKQKRIIGGKSSSNKNKMQLPLEEIKELYLNKHFTIKQLCNKYYCSHQTMRKNLVVIFGSEYNGLMKQRRKIIISSEDLENLKLNKVSVDILKDKYYCEIEDIEKIVLKDNKKEVKDKALKLPLEELKRLYLQGYAINDLAKKYNCDRHTISRRLKVILGEDYPNIKHNIKQEKMLNLARQHYNSIEIGKLLNCSSTTVMYNLKKIMGSKEFKEYKKRNRSRKFQEIYEKHVTPEFHEKRIEAIKVYSLWDGSKVHFNKKTYDYKGFNYPYHSPLKSFYLRYNGRDVNLGGNFIEFLSPTIIHDLIKEFSEEKFK